MVTGYQDGDVGDENDDLAPSGRRQLHRRVRGDTEALSQPMGVGRRQHGEQRIHGPPPGVAVVTIMRYERPPLGSSAGQSTGREWDRGGADLLAGYAVAQLQLLGPGRHDEGGDGVLRVARAE